MRRQFATRLSGKNHGGNQRADCDRAWAKIAARFLAKDDINRPKGPSA